MRRHSALIPFSKQHHQILVLAQLLKSDVPDYKGMPQNPAEKLLFFNKQFQQYVLPNIDAHRKQFYPQLKAWGFKQMELVESIMEIEDQILHDYKTIQSEVQYLESCLNDIGYALDEWVRIKERRLYELAQNDFNSELDNLDLK